MAYTPDGHHIPGTPLDSHNTPTIRARCGGPNFCDDCKSYARSYLNKVGPILQPGPYAKFYPSQDGGLDHPARAKRVVVDYYNNKMARGETISHVPLTENEVYIVWFSKVLQNWKALVSTEIPDGMYYELTYNGEKKELYLDAYRKTDNVVFRSPENEVV